MSNIFARLTTDTPQNNLETMLNYAYAKDGKVILRYGEGNNDIDLCEYIAKQTAGSCQVSPDEVREGACMECDCHCAILFCVATQAAELRARLKRYEDQLEQGDLAEVRHGEWVKQLDGTHYCSECGHDATYTYDGTEICGVGCPFCYAKMDGKGSGRSGTPAPTDPDRVCGEGGKDGA